MKYQFVPISQRKPLRWPNGKRLALMITTNLEYWDATKDTPKPFYPGGPALSVAIFRATCTTIRITLGASTAIASECGACLTSSTNSACHRPVQ